MIAAPNRGTQSRHQHNSPLPPKNLRGNSRHQTPALSMFAGLITRTKLLKTALNQFKCRSKKRHSQQIKYITL